MHRQAPWTIAELTRTVYSSERIISLAHAFGRPFARLHMHLERIYGPVAHRLNKLPALVGSESSLLKADSPLPRTLSRFAEKARNGDGLELAWRAMDSVAEVLRRIGHKYSEGSSGKSGPDPGSARSGP